MPISIIFAPVEAPGLEWYRPISAACDWVYLHAYSAIFNRHLQKTRGRTVKLGAYRERCVLNMLQNSVQF